jgi:hypothetical protein
VSKTAGDAPRSLQSELAEACADALRDVERLSRRAEAAENGRGDAVRRYDELVAALTGGGFTTRDGHTAGE